MSNFTTEISKKLEETSLQNGKYPLIRDTQHEIYLYVLGLFYTYAIETEEGIEGKENRERVSERERLHTTKLNI